MRVNLLVNTFRTDALAAARQASDFLVQHKVEVGADRDSASLLELPPIPPNDFADAELIISFGGDGTLIRAAHLTSAKGTPILGVYYGRFGFVTQCEPSEVGAALSQFFDGKAIIDKRMMIRTDLIREGTTIASLHCLNEAAVQRSATTRMLTFDVHVNGRLLARYPADGIMVATPTGSTAYNLSAGGPVVDPHMDAQILTAIMPHTLSARPLVLKPDAIVDIKVETRGDAVMSCDGQSRLHLLSGDAVRVTRSERTTNLVMVDESDFLDKLSERLQWSKGPILGDVDYE